MKNTPFSRLLIIISTIFLLGALVITVHHSWADGTTSRIVEVDDNGDVGIGTAVAVNSLGQEVIAYHDFTNSSLKIAVCDTESCSNPEIETVDNDGYVGEMPDMVINSQDRPIISHYDRILGDLRLSVCNDSFCTSATTQIVDQVDEVGVNSSIVLDDAGRPIISYFDVTNTALKIAYCNDLACASPTITTVDASGASGFFTSLKLDDNGLAVIAYYDVINQLLKAAFCNDTTCSAPLIRVLDNVNDAGQYPSLAIVSGRVFISYFRADGVGKELKMVRCNDATCGSFTILDLVDVQSAQYSSMVMSDSGQAFISFWDEGEGDLVIAACIVNPTSGCKGATFTRVDRFDITGLHTDITLTQEGNPLVSYYDQDKEALNMAECPLCRVPARADLGPVSNQDSIALALTDIGYPIVTYQDTADNAFYLVFCQDTVCKETEKISLGGNLHINPSMKLQENGRPAVVYYFAGTNELQYTVCNNDDCTDNTTNVIAFDGYDPSLQFNSQGLPVISYYDAGNDDLVLARCSDIACSATVETLVDGLVDSVGSYSSMILTAEDYPIISYYDATNDTIKYAICNDAGCSAPLIDDTQGTDGPYNALGLSESGRLYIAFYNSGGSGLNMFECNLPCNGGGGIGALDYTATDVGWDISMVIGEDGYPLVSYYDVEIGALRMATCLSYSCSLGATLGVIDTMGGDNGHFTQMALNGRGQPVIAHANLSVPTARIEVFNPEPILYQVYAPVIQNQ